MMGICTTLIGVLPTYAQIGIFAPVLLVTLRIIQGLGAGAEISGAGTMLAEYAPKGKRGIISSLVAMGTNCGTLSATAIWAVMFFALEREQLIARDGVFLSGERRCHDIRDLAANESERKPGIRKSKRRRKIASVNACVRKYIGRDVYQQIFLAGHRFAFWTSGNSGLIQTFLAGYLVQTLLFNKSIPTDALMISSVIGFITIPLLGWLSDKYGRRLPYIIPKFHVCFY